MLSKVEQADAKKVEQALEYLNDGDFELAQIILEEVCSRCPENYEYEFTEGDKHYIKLWDNLEFLSYLNKMEEIYWIPSVYPRACYYLAYILIEKGKYKKAISWLNKGLLMEPQNPKFFTELGAVYGRLGDYFRSLDYYKQALNLPNIRNHERAIALRGAGVQLINLGHLDEAKNYLKESLEIEENNDIAINELNYISKVESNQKSRIEIIKEKAKIRGIIWEDFIKQVEMEFNEPITVYAREAVVDFWNHWTMFSESISKRLLSLHIDNLAFIDNFPQYKKENVWKKIGLIIILMGLITLLFNGIIGIILILTGIGIRYYNNYYLIKKMKAYAKDLMKDATLNPAKGGYSRLCANYIVGLVGFATQQTSGWWPQLPSNVLTGLQTVIETDNIIFNNRILMTKSPIDLYLVKVNNKYGYIDRTGRIVIEPKIDESNEYFNGYAIIRINNKSGVIDQNGKVFIHPDLFDILHYSDGIFQFEKNNRFGYINEEGAIIIEPIFDFGWEFSEGLAGVELNQKWGFINKFGVAIIEPQFDEAGSFSNGLAPVRIGTKWGYIDKTGKFIVEPKFDRADDYYDDLAIIMIDNKWGYIDKFGEIIIKPQFDKINRFSEGLSAVKIGNYWGYIDKKGKMVIKTQFSSSNSFSEGLALIKVKLDFSILSKNEKFGFIDQSGGMIIEPIFDNAGSFSMGLAPVKIGSKWGYIDKTGRIVIDCIFDKAHIFHKGLARIETGNRIGYINSAGEYIWEPRD
ncbi:MAG TPA: WG repeat-containing protein [Candidatus Marinimicrobia bacterium]|nr:WG repeat-containing protein [Candidatus Neomarinimicrobiota bacterium]HRS51617.1 WG repeat-containing protein [Candidatus Neomarinimicrobiota bacterium]HRU92305.1 WG repeat-containing protein [Candidatus Neomarinimicrobiota bacterium]